MKIIIDSQIFSVQEHGGVSRLFAELQNNLKKINVDCDIPLVFCNNAYINEKKSKSFFKEISFPGKLTLIRLINKANNIWYLKNEDFDVFQPTYFDDYFLKYLNGKPYVLTIYDLIHEKYYSDSPRLQSTLRGKKNLIQNANRIIAISGKTKSELVDYYKINPNKVEVIYPANSLDLSKIQKCKVPNKYILFVGSRGEYKNFDVVLRSLNKIDDQTYLACAGGGNFNSDELSKIEKYGISKRVVQINVNDRELAYCYKNALCFVFSSLYEGFGIPILEAFSCSCPAILSDIEVFREVAGNAAKYFNPKSANSLSTAVNSVINNGNFRNRLIDLGNKRLKLYSWSKMAKETLEVYESVIKK